MKKKEKQLQTILANYLGRITLIVMIIILFFSLGTQTITAITSGKKEADRIFVQMSRILDRNSEDLSRNVEEYSLSCINNAKTIAYMIQYHKEALDSLSELKKIASYTEVDEIHIFDKNGVIVNGTHPEYYGYSFDSGEQMQFFKPMLEDKSLELVQEIMPNTAEGKLVQYSALWSEDGEFIVEIGMYPVSIMRIMEKNNLSYIFSILLTGSDVSLYAFDEETLDFVASTDPLSLNKTTGDMGFDFSDKDIPEGRSLFKNEVINGRRCFVAYRVMAGSIIAYVIPFSKLFEGILLSTAIFLFGILLLSVGLIVSMTRHIDKYVVKATNKVNEGLRSITDGNLETVVLVNSSKEFLELSRHINVMVGSLLSNIEKLSYILSKSKTAIGVYEYIGNSSSVRYTSYTTEILKLPAKSGRIEKETFLKALEEFKKNPKNENENVYEVPLKSDDGTSNIVYIHFEENRREGETVGILTNVTDQVLERRRIEKERDMDALTGLYNRRGLDGRLDALKNDDAQTGYCALFMIDADGLKETNDRYGHAVGDLYLKKIAEILSGIGRKNRICARPGGDEFVLFLYGYEDQTTLREDIAEVFKKQDNIAVDIADEMTLDVRFSAGYTESKGCFDIEGMIENADIKMYENKRARKGEGAR